MSKKQVLGFLMNEDKVVLIRKRKGTWQEGRLNGIGGTVEEGETFHEAMVREFEEEAGIRKPVWSEVGQINLLDSDSEEKDLIVTIFFAYASVDDLHEVKTMTDEKVDIYDLQDVFKADDVLFNVKYMLMILAESIDNPFLSFKFGV